MSNFDAMTIADKLKRLRKDRRISQEEVAARCQVSQGLVSLWERGQNVPSLAHGAELADLFGVSVDYLSHAEDERPAGEIEAEVRVREAARLIGWRAIYLRIVTQSFAPETTQAPAPHEGGRRLDVDDRPAHVVRAAEIEGPFGPIVPHGKGGDSPPTDPPAVTGKAGAGRPDEKRKGR